MDFQELLVQARSCRRFNEKSPLSPENLDWLINCARICPSARNAQVLRYIPVSYGKTCLKLFAQTRWGGALKDWGGPAEGERPTGFIVLLAEKNSGKWTPFDAGIAAQTMQLAATSKGWGVCMLGSFNAEAVQSLLDIPEELEILLVLGVGVAQEKRVLASMPESGSFAYWRDDAEVHYVPKRALADVILKKF